MHSRPVHQIANFDGVHDAEPGLFIDILPVSPRNCSWYKKQR